MLTVLGASQLIYTQSTRNSVPYYNEQIKQQAQRTATDGANSQSLPLIAQPSSCFFSPPSAPPPCTTGAQILQMDHPHRLSQPLAAAV